MLVSDFQGRNSSNDPSAIFSSLPASRQACRDADKVRIPCGLPRPLVSRLEDRAVVADTKDPTMTQLMERLEQLGEAMRAYADSILSSGDDELVAVAGEASGSKKGAKRAKGAPQVA